MHAGGTLPYGQPSPWYVSAFHSVRAIQLVVYFMLWFNFTIVMVWHFPLFWCMPTYLKKSNCTKGSIEPRLFQALGHWGWSQKQAGDKRGPVHSFSLPDPAPHQPAFWIIPIDGELGTGYIEPLHNFFFCQLPSKWSKKMDKWLVVHLARWGDISVLSTACYTCTSLFSAIHLESFPVQPFYINSDTQCSSKIMIWNPIVWSLK